jgi:transcriptional regulator with XRE-family HTH domain
MSSNFFSVEQSSVEAALQLFALALVDPTQPMARTRRAPSETFGRRLARLRKARGLTQIELAPKLGISPRMLAYYEAQTDRPPAHLLGRLAEILGASTDELLGLSAVKLPDQPSNPRLWRRLRIVEKLPAEDRTAVLKFIDALARQKFGDQHG